MENPEEAETQSRAVASPPRRVAMLVRHSRYLERRRGREHQPASLRTAKQHSPTRKRSRLIRRFLRLAQGVGAIAEHRNTVAQGFRSLQLHCEYDAASYHVDIRERSVPGPMAMAFSFYAKILDPRVATGHYYPSFQDIERAAETMTFTELLAFCWDFKIVPQLISRGDLRYIFTQITRSKDDKLTELTYKQFEEMLTRIAMVAFYPLSAADVKRIGMTTMGKLRDHIEGKRIRLQDVFKKFDASGDGILSRSELMAGLRDVCGDAIKQRDLEAVYSLVDEDGGGEVEYQEFVDALDRAAPPAFSHGAGTKANDAKPLLYSSKMADYEDDSDDDDAPLPVGGIVQHVHKQTLHDMLSPTASIEEDTGTVSFPGGKDLSPPARVQALIKSLGKLTISRMQHIIMTRGRLTAGRMNGTISSKDAHMSSDDSEEVHATRMLRTRDGTMCDYTAPHLMKRRNAARADFTPDLTRAWHQFRSTARVDDWRSFHAPCLYMGSILVMTEHLFRIILRNPLPRAITIEAHIENTPGVTATFSRLPVASGMTTTIVVAARPQVPGEIIGAVDVRWRCHQVEVLARSVRGKRREQMHEMGLPDLDSGVCSVPIYADVVHSKHFKTTDPESRCPADEFATLCAQRCPRYQLPSEHPVHRYEVPSASGDWHRRQPCRATDGTDGISSATWRRRPIRSAPQSTLPRPGAARLNLKHLPSTKNEPNLSEDSSVDLLPDWARSMRSQRSQDQRRGILPHVRAGLGAASAGEN